MPAGRLWWAQAESRDRRCFHCVRRSFSARLPELQLCVLNCVFFLCSPRSLASPELHSVAYFPVVGWRRVLWAAPALLAALAWFVVLVSLTLAWFVVLVSLTPVLFAAQAIALVLAGEMVVEAEVPAKAPSVALN